MGMITTPTARSSRIAATTLLPFLAVTCSSFALLPPPTCRATKTPSAFSKLPSSPAHILPSTWVGARQLTTMTLAATDDKDENDDITEQENTTSLATNDTPTTIKEKKKVQTGKTKLLHSVTVCMVPPPENLYVWEQVSEMRRKLKDPGYYRWPPHANLLYPFLALGNTKDDSEAGEGEEEESMQTNLQEIVTKLQTVMSQCPPFRIQLRQFGTFGGKQRGVLWLDPESYSFDDDETGAKAPLIQLHSRLQEAFPDCKGSNNGGYTPHMTLSHFENLEAAKAAQELISIPINPNLEFVLDRIYLLERIGDNGQFLRVAEIGLGKESLSKSPKEAMLDPPAPFPGMPTSEEDWVHEERMKLKSRRNGQGKRGGGTQQQRRRSWTPRVPDTPDVIAAKQAERKAKREGLAREQEPATGEASK